MLDHLAGRNDDVGHWLRATKFPYLSPQIYRILKAILREYEEHKQAGAAERRARLDNRKGKGKR